MWLFDWLAWVLFRRRLMRIMIRSPFIVGKHYEWSVEWMHFDGHSYHCYMYLHDNYWSNDGLFISGSKWFRHSILKWYSRPELTR